MNEKDLEKLKQLIADMDLPILRKTQLTPHNLRWLGRNMGISNGNHSKYQEARALLAKLIRESRTLP